MPQFNNCPRDHSLGKIRTGGPHPNHLRYNIKHQLYYPSLQMARSPSVSDRSNFLPYSSKYSSPISLSHCIHLPGSEFQSDQLQGPFLEQRGGMTIRQLYYGRGSGIRGFLNGGTLMHEKNNKATTLEKNL
ncbi:uncharacterized protein N7479_010060 [Penicillium vulpinum]|uniref:uncharacterized protein n=1 Tax=Penicillium vulpinum TaxID=29845 RepID=UPI0025488561|nr:uncharacterized protein N7479_010060 [Penicillium vulpinum]KAJ5951647.1 hypothetical protein N7479_010060 [Penicillium vulpinum]